MSLLQALTETGCAVCGKHGGNVRFTCVHHFAVESIADELYETTRLRIARHDSIVRSNGGFECQDEFCNTFRPIIAKLRA